MDARLGKAAICRKDAAFDVLHDKNARGLPSVIRLAPLARGICRQSEFLRTDTLGAP